MPDSLRSLLDRVPLDTFWHVVSIAIPILIVFVIGSFALSLIERAAIRRFGNRAEPARVRLAIRVLRYALIGILLLIAIFSYAGSWTGLGVSLGVVAAAAGFALQRPAASVAAWLTILLKRPFAVGDRIVVGTIARGDVRDITLTHTYLAEVGRYGEEDVSGRMVMVPNSVLFEMAITRYGESHDDSVLGEVQVMVTYGSDVPQARRLFEAAAAEIVGSPAHSRVKLMDSGVQLEIRYDAPIAEANRIASDISARFLEITAENNTIEFAYPRRDIRMVQE